MFAQILKKLGRKKDKTMGDMSRWGREQVKEMSKLKAKIILM